MDKSLPIKEEDLILHGFTYDEGQTFSNYYSKGGFQIFVDPESSVYMKGDKRVILYSWNDLEKLYLEETGKNISD